MSIKSTIDTVVTDAKADAAKAEATATTWADFIKTHAIAAAAISSFLLGFAARGLI